MQTNDIIKDISFLYELALSVGQSLDKKENCKRFLHTLMSFKNIEFGGVWLRNYNIPYSNKKTGYRAIYTHPLIKLTTDLIPDSEFLENCFLDCNSFSCILSEEISNSIAFKVKEGGVTTFFNLDNLGFMVLYSSSENRLWSEIDQTKLRNVIEKFSISIKACLFHEKSIQDLITITETKKELEKAKKEAEKSEKLKSAFLSNVSHEIRTPINAIVGFSNLLSDKDIEQDQHNGFISHISNNSRKLLKMINNLIDVSKMETNQLKIQKEEFVLNPILMDLHKTHMNRLASNDIDLKLSLPEKSDRITLFSDKNKVIQIFDNLIDNAVKFTSRGIVEIGYFIEDNSSPIFYIKDTGIGISPKKQDIIFDMFRQGENSSTRKFEGFGIGLTLCKRLVELMNGEIWFNSKEDIGSNFYFKINDSGRTNLSLLNECTVINKSPNTKNGVNIIEYSNKNVLIAEDVKSNFNYLNAIIELTDANVIWAKNGKDAIDICKANNPQIDLVLMDIKMPEIGGLDAIKEIKLNNKDIPVVVQTAFTLNDERTECFEAGADEFITKPIDPHKLIEILQKFL